VALLAAVSLIALTARAEEPNLAEIGAKLSDPTSNVWALFTEFDLTFSDGDLNTGDAKVGGNMIFQPILPIPLWGRGKEQWKILSRPTLPFIFSNPVPTGFDQFDHETGLGDFTVNFLVNPPTGRWLLALGPAFLFPTATKDAFGQDQFGIGPAAVVGYKTKEFVAGVIPQYYLRIGSNGDQADKPDASFLSMTYFGLLNLPNAWQVGFTPVIEYDNKASKGNRWNLPVGLLVAKTTKVGRVPVKFQLSTEYSVVHQDDFGKRFLIKFNVIPVVRALIQNPILGGG